MSEPFVGEIRMFAGSFAPRSHAFCDGQVLSISQNDALFSLLGTIYGGDGRTTFGLPDLRGRVPLHTGTGPGLSVRPMGQRAGQERVTVSTGEMPAHSHASATTAPAAFGSPGAKSFGDTGSFSYYGTGSPTVDLNAAALATLGGSQSHNNLAPFLCINFIIALFGIYPSRS